MLRFDELAPFEPPVAGEPLGEGMFPLKVKAYCGFYVGAPKWQGTTSYEPDECQWEAEIVVDGYEFAEGCVSVRCPDCGATLHQADDHFEALDPVPSLEQD